MLGVAKLLARLCDDIVALVYPPQCGLCLTPAVARSCRFVCEKCWHGLHTATLPPLRDWKVEPPSSTLTEYCDFDLAAWQYRGAMSVLIPTMKYREHPSIANIFGAIAAQRMRERLDSVLVSTPVLIPVPLHPLRQRERGFNQSVLIAKSIATQWRLQTWPHAIRRARFTDSQAKLSVAERLINVTEAFAPGREIDLRGRTVLLVDDVITTGATISACARVAKEMGATSVGAIALARGGGLL